MTLLHQRIRARHLLQLSVWLLSQLCFAQHEHHSSPNTAFSNFANPTHHPYADNQEGRSQYRYRNASRNDKRLYDFYSRQADYYISAANIPEILPAFPGLDGGTYGHWGAHSEMGRTDGKWDRMQFGPALASLVANGQKVVRKGLSIKVGNGKGLSALFDTETLIYRAIWKDGFLDFPETRWGLMGIPQIDGELLLDNYELDVSDFKGRNIGHYFHDDHLILEYQVQDSLVLEMPLARSEGGSSRFIRLIELPIGVSSTLRLPILSNPALPVSSDGSSAQVGTQKKDAATLNLFVSGSKGKLVNESGTVYLEVETAAAGELLALEYSITSKQAFPTSLDLSAMRPSAFKHGGSKRWGDALPVRNLSSYEYENASIDTLGVPLGNHFLAPMFLSGLDFFENGDAAISTFFGDVWIVSNISSQDGIIYWKRIATGLHQPLGLRIIEGVIHTIGRDQITALHDLNGDSEIDFYETVFNDFETELGSHDFNADLQVDQSGRLYFASPKLGVARFDPTTHSLSSLASGIRNPNGIGVTPGGQVLASTQEGEWTPASMIVKAENANFFGWDRTEKKSATSSPLVYLPRGLDHSSSSQIFIDSPEWKTTPGSFLGLSYGACSFYSVIENEYGQGAVFPLEGEFLAGPLRARFHPISGDLYVVGTQGWGTYAQYEGSFERVRVKEKSSLKPTDFKVYTNGIQLSFPKGSLAPEQDLADQFCQQWNYKYSSGYGSPEYSVRSPNHIGHDPVSISSTTVSQQGDTVFLEMPDIRAAMQTHLRYHLAEASGSRLSGDLFITALNLEYRFDPDKNKASRAANEKRLNLEQHFKSTPTVVEEVGSKLKGRLISLQALPGLKYDRNSISVSAGETIRLRLENIDTMPHNWLLGKSGSYEQIGQLSENLANDSRFSDDGYIPKSELLLAAIPTVLPGEAREVQFRAPTQPGTYPFLCTYPGHWKLMKGTLIVY